MVNDPASGNMADYYLPVFEWMKGNVWQPTFQGFVREIDSEIRERFDFSMLRVSTRLPETVVGMLWLALLDGFLTVEFTSDPSYVVDAYLEEHRDSLSPDAIELFTGVRKAAPSLYEIVAIDPVISFRDKLRRSPPFTIDNFEMLGDCRVGELCLARQITIAGRPRFTPAVLRVIPEGAAPFVTIFEDAKREELEELPLLLRKEPRTVRRIADRILLSMTSIAIGTWLAEVNDLLGEASDDDGTDDEAYSATRVEFPLLVSEEEATARFDAAEDFLRREDDEQKPYWDWSGHPPTASSLPYDDEDEEWNVATIDGWLLADAPCDEDAAALRERIEALFGTDVGVPNVHEIYREPDDEDDDYDSEADLADRLENALDAHYINALDSPIPMLGGKTPREAVLTEDGALLVADWLTRIEAQYRALGAGAPVPDYNYLWLWSALGLPLPPSPEA